MGKVTIALYRSNPTDNANSWVELNLTLGRSTIKLLRYICWDGSVLLWFRGHFHRVIEISRSGEFTVDLAPVQTENQLPMMVRTDYDGDGTHAEPNQVTVRAIQADRKVYSPGWQ